MKVTAQFHDFGKIDATVTMWLRIEQWIVVRDALKCGLNDFWHNDADNFCKELNAMIDRLEGQLENIS